MFLALGAASSAIGALKALTSSKSSSAQSTGLSQDAKSPFDLMSSTSSASVGSGTGSGSGGGGSQISPQTMSALLDAQSQSLGCIVAVDALKCVKGLVRQGRQ